jgi:hypothetical protein
MERILILIEHTGIEPASLEFACYLTRLTNSKLTGLFMKETDLHDQNIVIKGPGTAGAYEVAEELQLTESHNSRQEFFNFCARQGLRWTPDIIEAANEEDILIESRFADLLIVNSDSSFSDDRETVPTTLVTSLLKHSECPVLIAPLNFEKVNEVVFAYDGSPSSVYAIRQFTHLFPQLQDQKVTFLEVNEDFSKEIDYRDKITNYLKMHYSSIGYQVLNGEPEDELFSYFLRKRHVMVVMGSFGRKMLPGLFNSSTANLLLKTTSLPVFIAHR